MLWYDCNDAEALLFDIHSNAVLVLQKACLEDVAVSALYKGKQFGKM